MRYTHVLLSLALAVPALPAAAKEKARPILELQTFAINMNPGIRNRAETMRIVIERWSTDEERERLRSTLIEKGSDALLSALQKIRPKVGYMQRGTRLAWNLYYAREIPFEGGRRIVVGSDRPMSFYEASRATRSRDYAFTLAEIRVHDDGKGEGRLVEAAKVQWDADTRSVVIENYENQPVRLNEVRVVGQKEKEKEKEK